MDAAAAKKTSPYHDRSNQSLEQQAMRTIRCKLEAFKLFKNKTPQMLAEEHKLQGQFQAFKDARKAGKKNGWRLKK